MNKKRVLKTISLAFSFFALAGCNVYKNIGEEDSANNLYGSHVKDGNKTTLYISGENLSEGFTRNVYTYKLGDLNIQGHLPSIASVNVVSGSLEIKGNVGTSDFYLNELKASGDIRIDGDVEDGLTVKAGGNVTITGKAGKNLKVIAGGKVSVGCYTNNVPSGAKRCPAPSK